MDQQFQRQTSPTGNCVGGNRKNFFAAEKMATVIDKVMILFCLNLSEVIFWQGAMA